MGPSSEMVGISVGAAKLQLADRKTLWQGSETLSGAYNDSVYQPKGEHDGMFTRIGLDKSCDTIIYATNHANRKFLSLESQIERFSDSEAKGPNFRRPDIMRGKSKARQYRK